MAIYNIETDEITTSQQTPTEQSRDVPAVRPQTEGANQSPLQQQLTQLEADRKQTLADTQSSYDAFLQSLDEEGNAIDALTSTVKKRKVVDPEQMRIRRNIANLYDALQLTGALAGMATGGRGTIGTPAQLTSATATHNTLAERLQEQQRQADNAYTEALANMTHRQQTARANLNKQRLQANNNFERAKQDINKHYDTQTRLINEGEAKRKNALDIAIRRNANALEVAQVRAASGRSGGKSSDYTLFEYDGNNYKLPRAQKSDFSAAVGLLVQNSFGAIRPEDLGRYGAKLSGTALHMAILRGVLKGDIPVNAETYNEALDIVDTYLSPMQSIPTATENTTSTKTDIPGFSTSTSSTGKITIPGF